METKVLTLNQIRNKKTFSLDSIEKRIKEEQKVKDDLVRAWILYEQVIDDDEKDFLKWEILRLQKIAWPLRHPVATMFENNLWVDYWKRDLREYFKKHNICPDYKFAVYWNAHKKAISNILSDKGITLIATRISKNFYNYKAVKNGD